MVKCLEILGYGTKGCGFKPELGQPVTGKLSVNQAVNGYRFSNQGRIGQ